MILSLTEIDPSCQVKNVRHIIPVGAWYLYNVDLKLCGRLDLKSMMHTTVYSGETKAPASKALFFPNTSFFNEMWNLSIISKLETINGCTARNNYIRKDSKVYISKITYLKP